MKRFANSSPKRKSLAAGAEYSAFPKFQTARASFHQSRLASAFGFSKIDWQTVKDKWTANAKPAPAQKQVGANI